MEPQVPTKLTSEEIIADKQLVENETRAAERFTKSAINMMASLLGINDKSCEDDKPSKYPYWTEDGNHRIRIAHYHEKCGPNSHLIKRILTVAYIFDTLEGENVIKYGGCMFTQLSLGDNWDRLGAISTAIARLESKAVVVPDLPEDQPEAKKGDKVKNYLRPLIMMLGMYKSNDHSGSCQVTFVGATLAEAFSGLVKYRKSRPALLRYLRAMKIGDAWNYYAVPDV